MTELYSVPCYLVYVFEPDSSYLDYYLKYYVRMAHFPKFMNDWLRKGFSVQVTNIVHVETTLKDFKKREILPF